MKFIKYLIIFIFIVLNLLSCSDEIIRKDYSSLEYFDRIHFDNRHFVILKNKLTTNDKLHIYFTAYYDENKKLMRFTKNVMGRPQKLYRIDERGRVRSILEYRISGKHITTHKFHYKTDDKLDYSLIFQDGSLLEYHKYYYSKNSKKIRKITINCYYNNLYKKIRFYYNDNGREIRVAFYDKNKGKPLSYYKLTEDINLNIIKYVRLDENKELKQSGNYKYNQDNRCIEYIEKGRDDRILLHFAYEYDALGNINNEIIYNQKKKVKVRKQYTYDESGKLKTKMVFDRENNLLAQFFYDFDYNRNVINEEEYDNNDELLWVRQSRLIDEMWYMVLTPLPFVYKDIYY